MESAEQGEDIDLLYGMPRIAAFLRMKPAQARHLSDKGSLPTFRIGRRVCARRSTLRQWLADQEAAARAKPQGGTDAG